MNIPDMLWIAVLGSGVANLIHWRGRKGEYFLYQPQSGFFTFLFFAWAVATVAASILFLTRTITMPLSLYVAVGLTIAQLLYSIAWRQSQRGKP